MNSKEEVYVFPNLNLHIIYKKDTPIITTEVIKISMVGLGRKKHTDGRYYLFPLIYNRFIDKSKDIAITINKMREEIDVNMKLCKIDPTMKDKDDAIMFYELDENQESENDRLYRRYFI